MFYYDLKLFPTNHNASLTVLERTVSARREFLEVNFTRNGSNLIGVATKLRVKNAIYVKRKIGKSLKSLK